MSDDCRTLAQLAKNALDVQNACNLTGVVHSFSRDVSRLRQIAHEEGWEDTSKVNSHPIVKLYIDKLASLCHCEFSQAYSWATLVHGEGK